MMSSPKYLFLFLLFVSRFGAFSQEFRVGLEAKDSKNRRSLPAIISVRATSSETELKGQMLNEKYVVIVSKGTEYQIVAAYQDYQTYRRTVSFNDPTADIQPLLIELVSTKEPAVSYDKTIYNPAITPTETASASSTPTIVTQSVAPKTKTSQEITIKVVDAISNETLAAKIKITDNVKETFSGSTNNTANYSTELPIQNEPYQLVVMATGYRTYQESLNLKNSLSANQSLRTIKLSKADVGLSINVLEEGSNRPLKAVIRVIDNESRRSAINTKDVASVVTQIQPDRKYLVEVEAVGYMPIAKLLNELLPSVQLNNTVTLTLKKFNQDAYITLMAKNATTGKAVPALFRVKGHDSQQTTEIITTVSSPIGKFKLIEPDIYKIETIAGGYKKLIADFDAEEIVVGQESVYEAKLVSFEPTVMKIPFSFQVTDASTGKNITNSQPTVVNQKTKKTIDTKANSTGFMTELEADNYYMVEVEANGYDKFSMKFEASSGGRAVFPVSMIPAKKAIAPPPATPRTVAKTALAVAQPIAASPKPTAVVGIPATKPTKKPTTKTLPKPIDTNLFDNIKAGQSLTVEDNVYFDQSSYILRYEAYPQLDKLVAVMWKYMNLKVEIIGHTDDVGDPRLNLILSENRAKVIANYLVNKGIKEDRILNKGMGQSKPLTANSSEDDRRRNRRVEFIIR